MVGRTRARRDTHPVSITSARTSHSADLRGRQRRYLISMGIRTVCFVLAVVVDGPLRWGLVVAAFVLPYIAVVAANAGRRASPAEPTYVAGSPRAELEADPASSDDR